MNNHYYFKHFPALEQKAVDLHLTIDRLKCVLTILPENLTYYLLNTSALNKIYAALSSTLRKDVKIIVPEYRNDIKTDNLVELQFVKDQRDCLTITVLANNVQTDQIKLTSIYTRKFKLGIYTCAIGLKN